MSVKLENDVLIIEINQKGAELTSISSKLSSIEYLWTADPAYWNRHAPVLFPIVGRLINNKYTLQGKKYSLNQHGFARDMDFSIVEINKTKAVLRLSSSMDTLEPFPYKFELTIQYLLKENSVEVTYTVKNSDEIDMYFSIGAHPGFNCPLQKDEKMEDYYLEFESTEVVSILSLTKDGYVTGREVPFLEDNNVIPLSKDLFKDDALIFHDLRSDKISLKNKINDHGVSMAYPDFPYLGIWSKPTGAPFVCIEPWYGIADYVGFDSDLKHKKGILKLEPGKEFNCQYCLSFF